MSLLAREEQIILRVKQYFSLGNWKETKAQLILLSRLNAVSPKNQEFAKMALEALKAGNERIARTFIESLK